MPSFEHSQLVKRIATIDTPPTEADQHGSWLEAHAHLKLLDDNAREDEMIIHAIGESTFIHTVVVDQKKVSPLDREDLLRWNGSAFASRSAYVWGGGQTGVWIVQDGKNWQSETLKGAKRLVFGRSAEGFSDNVTYYEIFQEYTHLADIHWRPEHTSYCRINQAGDIECAISFSLRNDSSPLDLVSFRRDLLDQYLAVTNSVLVRLFDFTLLVDRRSFRGWGDDSEVNIDKNSTFFARQKVRAGYAAYTRGIQIIRPLRPKSHILKTFELGRGNDRYVEFKAFDFRNDRVTSISTDPLATTNYFKAQENLLPFETSPAFFCPEVLLKYKNDREKYEVLEENRLITCRGGWSLRGYDINEAGQLHAYIVDLRFLPYEEQLYWLSFNEEPKTGISKRALERDFKGEWSGIIAPLENLLALLRKWTDAKVSWWTRGSDKLFAAVNTPYTSSTEEWSQAFLDLAKLLVEGFQLDAIRSEIQGYGISFDKEDRSIALLEKLMVAVGTLPNGARLKGLRELQGVRSKVTSHVPGRRADELKRSAWKHHGSYRTHFESTCTTIVAELTMIEDAFKGKNHGG